MLQFKFIISDVFWTTNQMKGDTIQIIKINEYTYPGDLREELKTGLV